LRWRQILSVFVRQSWASNSAAGPRVRKSRQ